MTEKDKELLFQDLCSRLPYGVICHCDSGLSKADLKLVGIDGSLCKFLRKDNETDCYLPIEWVKPYLFEMTGMSDEEKEEFIQASGYDIEESVNGRHYEYYLKDYVGTKDCPKVNTESVNWLNNKRYNYRLPEHLYIKVTEDNNPYKENENNLEEFKYYTPEKYK